jgi:hypothetical protein
VLLQAQALAGCLAPSGSIACICLAAAVCLRCSCMAAVTRRMHACMHACSLLCLMAVTAVVGAHRHNLFDLIC